MNDNNTDAAVNPNAATFLGHPRGLLTLFFTEMWERLSYYGMRAILILFLVDATATGGFGLDDKTAAAIYGLYTAGVYLVALPGGWIADRLLGAQRAVWWGGVIIMIGHLLLAIAATHAVFYLGLITIIAGTGLLKPNIATLVADLYPEGGGRRDAGYTLFYFGINMGGFLGPLLVAGLAHIYGWHAGFGAAAAGMALGLVQFKLTKRHLYRFGLDPNDTESGSAADYSRRKKMLLMVGVVAVALLGALFSGVLPFSPIAVARKSAWLILIMALAFFAYLLLFAKLTEIERRRVYVVFALFIASALFWAGFEQAGSSLNLFGDRYTDRIIDSLQFEIPAGWFQSVNSFFILLFAPVFAALWLALAKRNRDLSAPAKLALGLLQVGAGFWVMSLAAHYVAGGEKVLPTWLLVTYLLHTFGELCLSPVGMSAVTKLIPQRFVGQIMGVWYLSISLGNLVASLFAGEFDANNLAAMPSQYMSIVWFVVIPGVVLLLLVKPLKKAASGVQ
jgi:POT family proton-dependent oligopeptide transporter